MSKTNPITLVTHRTSTAATDPLPVVEAFLAALEALDLERALSLLAPDVTYQNVPLPPVRGRAATKRTLEAFLIPFTGFEVTMLAIAATDGVVLTERIDTFTRGPVRISFWVCGTFEVRDGLITVWRDRFDLADVTLAVIRGLAMAPVRALRS